MSFDALRKRLTPAAPLTSLVRRAHGIARGALDTLLPPLCLSCSALVGEPGALCATCWSKVSFLAPPLCARCGFPFEADAGPDTLCGACLKRPPRYDRARAAFRYEDGSRGLVLAFKHGDRTDAAPAYGRWLARAGAELLADADFLAPVPLHRWRLFWRRYNQAALLAHAAGKASGRGVLPDLLIRRRNTPSQADRDARERRRNVAGAFALNERYRPFIRGRRVVLVDDVLTTGATVEACTRVLRLAGAERVDVLALARVVRPEFRS
jgi:ComF family protein